jgi:hypothetical protein
MIEEESHSQTRRRRRTFNKMDSKKVKGIINANINE